MSAPTALAITAGVLLAALLVGLILRAGDGRRRGGHGLRIVSADLAPAALARNATLVQFSTETCARCPQVRRMLGELVEGRDGTAHLEIDLTHRSDLAARYHVLQTPTTFLVDAFGAVVSRWSGVPQRAEISEALGVLLPVREQR